MKKTIQLNESSQDFKKLNEEWLKFEPKSEKELFRFIHELTTKYQNDYGTSVHLAVALMKAVFEYVEHLEGFTGFQVDCMKWLVLKKIFLVNDVIGMKLVKYSDILYPQYIEKFGKTIIDKEQHNLIVKMAKDKLAKHSMASVSVIEHWKRLVAGWLPTYIVVEE